MNKSMKFLDGNEYLQSRVTNQAFLFAQLLREETKRNKLTQEQVLKEAMASTRKRS